MGCFSGASTKSTSTQQNYTPEQASGLKKALDVYLPTLGQGQQVFQGERIAGFNPQQMEALDIKGFLDAFAPQFDMPLYGETGRTLGGLLSGEYGAQKYSPESASRLFSQIYENPAFKTFSEKTLPGVQEAYSGPGYWSGSRARGETEAAQDLADTLGQRRGEFEMAIEEANRNIDEAKANRMLGAVPLAQQYGFMPTQESLARLQGRGALFDFATQEQNLRQQQINAAIQKFAEENRITDPENMQILLALLGLNYGTATSTSTGTSAGLGYEGLSSLFGSLGKGLGEKMTA